MAKIIATFEIPNQTTLDKFNNEIRENTDYKPNEINKDLLYKKVAIVGAVLYDSGAVSVTRSQSFFENATDDCPTGTLKEFVQAYIDVHYTTEEAKLRSEEDQALYNRWGYTKSTCKSNGFLFEWDEFQHFRDWYMTNLKDLNSVDGNNFTVADTCVMSKHSVTGRYDKTADNCIVVPKSLNMVINQHQRMNKMSIINGLKKAVEKTNAYPPILNFIQDVINIYYPANYELLSEYMTAGQQEDDEEPDVASFEDEVTFEREEEKETTISPIMTNQPKAAGVTTEGTTASQLQRLFRDEYMFYVVNSENDEPVTETMTYDEAVSWIRVQGSHDVAYDIKIEVTVSHSPKVAAREIKGL